ncbi:MAG: hypothetical protein COA78_03330 [Blastopirellula sp.]|nr:MAG: hypothetical protein COA78_03330 [Blastopirellula sp.]
MLQNKSKSQVLFLGILSVAGVVYVLFFLAPWQRSISQLQADVISKQTEIAGVQDLELRLMQLEKETVRLNTYLENWQVDSLLNQQAAKLFGQISILADQAGTDNLSLDPLQEVQMESAKSYPLALGCQGTYHEIQDFIYRIEQLPYEIWIEDIKLTPLANRDNRLQCEITLKFFIASNGNSD